jgi:TctA family transporter
VNFRRALTYSYGDFSTFYSSPISITLWLITFSSLLAPLLFRFIRHYIDKRRLDQ